MTCPRCQTENQIGNFCSECGEKLRERCPECGGMELIGRKICESLISKATEKKYEHVWRRVDKYLWLFVALTTMMPLLAPFLYEYYYTKGFHLNPSNPGSMLIHVFVMVIAIFVVCVIASIKYRNRRQERLLKNFSEKFPAEAEILRKAEGGKK